MCLSVSFQASDSFSTIPNMSTATFNISRYRRSFQICRKRAIEQLGIAREAEEHPSSHNSLVNLSSGYRQSSIASMDKRRSSSKKNDKGQRSSNVIKGGDDHEVSKRKGRRSSEVQSQRTDDPLKSPKGRRLSGWELREKLNNSPGRNSTGCLPNALTGSPRHTAKRHESLIASVHTSIDNCTHSAKPLLNLSSHSKCANSRAPSIRTADSALGQDDGFNLLKSTVANKQKMEQTQGQHREAKYTSPCSHDTSEPKRQNGSRGELSIFHPVLPSCARMVQVEARQPVCQ
jgi:hypothetical protein